ncbi:MAG: ribonuclease III [bacterium]
MVKELTTLERKLGVKFKNKNNLTQALVHRSYLNEHPEFHLDHNERLEFLGDAVLEIIVTENLFTNFPDPEGDLTNWRASLVNAINLASIADEIGIEPYLFLSKGEAKDSNPKSRQYILANAMEAVIGAIYLDQGIEVAKKFVEDKIISKLDNILKNKLYIDAKSYFQEMAQDKVGVTPVYKVISATGPDHAKTFEIGVYLDKELIATGKGTSKQEAQTNAAQNGLAKKSWNIK